MKKLFLSISFLVFASLFMFSYGQTEKTITITKKITDANGKETIETITLTGTDAENIDIQEYIEESVDDLEIDVEVNVEEILSGANKEKQRTIIMSDGNNLKFDNADGIEFHNNGENRIIIISDDEGIILEDMDEILEGSEFNWNNGENTFTFESFGEDNGSPKAFLGVWPGESTSDKGVVLGGIVESSAAEKGGLKEGDIITSIGGKETKSFSELATIIKGYEPNSNVVIQYLRNNEARSTNITLGEKKEEKRISYSFSGDENNFSKEEMFMRGMKPSCCQKTKEVEKAYIGIMIEDEENGIKIVDVNREDEILSQGDIITKFGKTKVSNSNELINAVSEYKPGDRVKVHYNRDGKVRKSKVTLLGRMVKECCSNTSCCSPEKEKTTKKTEIIIKKKKEIKSDLGNSLLELQEVNLFPNPTEGSFALEFTSENIAPITISITDTNGREIIKDEISDFDGKYSGNFNLKGNTPGLYLVNITQLGKVLTKKVIVK